MCRADYLQRVRAGLQIDPDGLRRLVPVQVSHCQAAIRVAFQVETEHLGSKGRIEDFNEDADFYIVLKLT